MGPCADFLPGTRGTMKAVLTNGTLDDKTYTLNATFYTKTGRKTLDKVFTVI